MDNFYKFLICFIAAGILILQYDLIHIKNKIKIIQESKIDLPEEYKLIDSTMNLKGYFDKDSVLHIEFKR